MKNSIFFVVIILLISIASFTSSASNNQTQTGQEKNQISEKNKLVVVWTSSDREVALKIVMMYNKNAKKNAWLDDITLLVWGPSGKLLSEDEELQKYVGNLKEAGVHLLACKGCADQYGITDKLTELGITVRYTGTDLTDFIKERHVITF